MASNPLQNFNIDKLNIFSNPLKMFFPKKMVGIDIGTAGIKVVELSRWGQGKTLENYAEIKSSSLYKEPFRGVEKGSYLLSNYFVSRAVRAVLDEAKIKTRAVIFSIPDFSTFCTSFELPPMNANELKDAVYYNASQYIPLPVSETTLDMENIVAERGNEIENTAVVLYTRCSSLGSGIAMKKVIINIIAIIKMPVLIAGDGVLKTH